MATIGQEIDGWIGEGAKVIDSYEKTKEQLVGHLRGISEQLSGFAESWEYKTGDAVSGEARPLHPNMVLGITTIRFVGVSRMPLIGAKVIQKVATWLTNTKAPKIATQQATRSIRDSLRSAKGLKRKSAIAGAIGVGTAKYLISKTSKTNAKRITAIITGATVAKILTTPTTPRRSGSEITEEWLMTPPSKRKRKESKWL